MSKGKLIIYTGCSGVGKGTIMQRLKELDKTVKLSVSCTTRDPRPGEVEGENYYFVTKEKFEDMIKNDEFLEYAQYCDNYYGTPLGPLDDFINQGYNVFLEIEVQGGLQVMKKRPDSLSIFIIPPSCEELEARLRGRGTEDEKTIQKRLREVDNELTYQKQYSYVVLNDDVNRAADEILKIIHKD